MPRKSVAGGSQLLGLPGETWEDIFVPQEPTLDEALHDSELFARYVAPYIDSDKTIPVRKEKEGQLSLETPRQTRREGRCKSCGGSIFWVTTEKNRKQLPLNPTPSHDECCGNFIMVDMGNERLARYVSDEARREIIAAGDGVWVSHFATCEGRRR